MNGGYPVSDQVPMPSTLADALLAIRNQRGALFMLDSSRWLIESWNLESDCLREQSEETIRLVQRLLNT
jgi:hypothetical protein